MNNSEEIIARDKQAEEYENWYVTSKGVLYDFIEKKVILDALNLQKTDIVLDAGCGTGRITRVIAKNCKKVYAVDFSPKSIEVLNRKLKEEDIYNVKTYVCSILDPLPIPEQVDKIICVQVIQHITNVNERLKAVENLYQKLKFGGCIVITVYNWNLFSKRTGNLKEGKWDNGIYYFRFTPNEAIDLLKHCKFKQISINGCINFWGYSKLNNFGLYKCFYPLGMVDVLLSKFKIYTLLGDFLIVKGIK